MDPYLETPQFWPGFHNLLIAEIVGALNIGLPGAFAANAQERVYIVPPRRAIIPDVEVKRTTMAAIPSAGSRTATLEPDSKHGVVIAQPERHHEMFVEIRSVTDQSENITIIEVLSPTNKAANSVGRDEYLSKQADVLKTSANLMEIDLLRGGLNTVAAPEDLLRSRGAWDHLVCLHRSRRPYHYEYWFNQLSEPLPVVKVPLTPDFSDLELDLQAVFDLAYDKGPYSRLVDYSVDPALPLKIEAAPWADALMRERGLR
jgi:hypothetical protein